MAPLFLRDFPNEAFDIPTLFSKAAILMPFLSIYCLILSKIIFKLSKNSTNVLNVRK